MIYWLIQKSKKEQGMRDRLTVNHQTVGGHREWRTREETERMEEDSGTEMVRQRHRKLEKDQSVPEKHLM